MQVSVYTRFDGSLSPVCMYGELCHVMYAAATLLLPSLPSNSKHVQCFGISTYELH